MPDADREADDPSLEKARRVADALTKLNARIARLALFLGVSLDVEADFQKVLAGDQDYFDRSLATGADGTQLRRLRQEWDELRGLMVLRCELMAHTLDDFGLEFAYQVATEVEKELEREGFRPGADGFDLLQRMKASRKSG